MTTVARTGRPRGAARARSLTTGVVPVFVAILAAYLLGRSIANDEIMLAGLVSSFVLVVALAQRAWLPYVGSAALVATFATPSSLPQFAVPGNPTMSDLMLVAAFAAWILVLARGDAELPSAFPLAPQLTLGVFLVAALGGILVGAANDGQSPVVAARDIAYYATFWLALCVFAGRERREFLFKLAAVGAVLIVAAQIVQGFLGADTLVFYDDQPLRELLRCPSGSCSDPLAEGFPRVRPPGLVLVYVVASFAASYLLWGPPRRRRRIGLLLGICMLGLLVSLNRNMLIGLTAGLLAAGLLASRRGRFIAVASVVLVLSLAVVELAGSSAAIKNNSIAARVLSLRATSELEGSATVSDRLRENEKALEALRDSPILGIGWGVPYGVKDFGFDDGGFHLSDRGFIHNQYLGLWLRSGLIGLVAFVAAMVLAIASGARWLRSRADRDDAWIGAGIITSLVAIAVSSLVAIYVIHPSWAAVIAGLLALAANLQREQVAPAPGRRQQRAGSASLSRL